MRTSLPLVLVATSLLVLTGCSVEPLPPGEGDPEPGDVTADCMVGTWTLDLPDYEAQALAYLTETGIPLVSYELNGLGTIEFTADGQVTTDIGIVTDYVVDAAGEQLTRQSVSTYEGHGDWQVGFAPGTIVISDYETEDTAPVDPANEGLPVTVIDIGSFEADCTTGELSLQGPVAAIISHWTR